MSDYILPAIFLLVISYSVIKKKNTYGSFVKGAKQAVPLVVSIFPFVASMFLTFR